MPEQNSKDKRDVMAARRHWRNYLERNQSIIVQLFCGQTRSEIIYPLIYGHLYISVLQVSGEVLHLHGGICHLQGIHQPDPAPARELKQVERNHGDILGNFVY